MEWIDLSVSKPTEDGCYLVFCEASKSDDDGYCDHIDIAYYSAAQGLFDNDFSWLVTHWQKIPDFPQKS